MNNVEYICPYYHPTCLMYEGKMVNTSLEKGQCWAQKEAPIVLCQGIRDSKHCEIFEEFKEEMNKTNDSVNHPSHYNAGNIECIDALAAATEGLQGIEAFCTANAIKYLWRWKWKNGKEDLDKAIWYIEHLKESLADTD